MYHTTGLTREQIRDLCGLIVEDLESAGDDAPVRPWPPSLGLTGSVIVTLTYLRRNRVQAEIGEAFGVSQPTVSRAVTALTPVLERVLAAWVPVAEDIDPHAQHLLDGTLVPCWSWANHPELYSGKHKTTGLNLQVACDLSGRLVWVSDPVDGRRHDVAAVRLSGVLDTPTAADDPAPPRWIGDKGYLGTGLITPIRKPPHRKLLDWEKTFNTDINRIRYQIERVIAHLKNWTVLHTDYRRPLETFAATISAVIGLEFFRTQP